MLWYPLKEIEMFQRSLLISLLLLMWVCGSAEVITGIKISGLKVLPRSTVVKYLPISKKDDVSPYTLNEATKKLYATGLFDRVELNIKKGSLYIVVHENPVIRKVVFKGGDLHKEDQLDKIKDGFSIKKGRIFNPQRFKELIFALESEYEMQGYFDVEVDYELKNVGKNSVDMTVNVHPGGEMKVGSIKYQGNTQFSKWTLNQMLGFRKTHFLSFLLKDDRYSRMRFDMGLDSIRDAYLDKGFLSAQVKKKVKYFKKKHEVKLYVDIKEGAQFKINSVEFTGFKLIQNVLNKLRKNPEVLGTLKGEAFSRGRLSKVREFLMDRFSELGYPSAQIELRTHINDKHKTVDLKFIVHKGNKINVRFIHFRGNLETDDYVLRHALKQMEGELYSRYNIEESKRRLLNLPYISSAEIMPQQVSSKEVDLIVSVKEEKTSMIRGELGYVEKQGASGSVSYEDANFFGTGRNILLKLKRSKIGHEVTVGYTQPYFLGTDASQSLFLSSKKTNASKLAGGDYTIDGQKIDVGLFYPVDDNWVVGGNINYSFDRVYPKDTSNFVAYVAEFINKHGSDYHNTTAMGSLGFNKLDQVIQPTEGLRANLKLARTFNIGSSSLPHYKVDFNAAKFVRIAKNQLDDPLILRTSFKAGYGRGYGRIKGSLPFYNRYYAGGLSSIRGYDSNSVGEKTPKGANFGGDLLTELNVDLIVPVFEQDVVTPSLFFDAGNVYLGSFKSSLLRYSAGLSLQVKTPVGPLAIAVAHPFHMRPGDRRKRFSLTVGKIFN